MVKNNGNPAILDMPPRMTKSIRRRKTVKTESAKPIGDGEEAGKTVTITAPNMAVVRSHIRGTAGYVQHRFGGIVLDAMRIKQEQGSLGKKGGKRLPKNFQTLLDDAKHMSTEGWLGIPCIAVKQAMMSACELVGFNLWLAKKTIRVLPDGFEQDGTPLIKITKGQPDMFVKNAPNTRGPMDLRVRPRWEAGWEAYPLVEYDADFFTVTDALNLLMRAGIQVGIGAGRRDSKKSCGQDWGYFEVLSDE